MRNHLTVAIPVFALIWGLTTHGKYSVSGDEPHYLLVAESLLSDGDLDLENNYARGDGRHFGHAGLAVEGHARRTASGAMLSVHDIGLPLALLPIYATARTVASYTSTDILGRFRMTRGLFAYSLVSLFMIALSALAAAVVFSRLREQVPRKLALAVILAAWLAPPVLSNSFVVFPEIPALLVSAAVVWVAYAQHRSVSYPAVVLVILSIGILPWFHRKFIVYSAGLAFVLLHRHWPTLRIASRARVSIALAAFVLPSVLLVTWTMFAWGTAGGPLMMERVPLALDTLKVGLIGALVDRESGLFVWAPIYLVAPAAFWLTGRRHWSLLVPVGLLFALSAAHDQWWGGFSPIGRFWLPVVPLVVIPVADALTSQRLRFTAIALLIPQVLMSACGWQYPRTLWAQGDGQNALLSMLPMGGKVQQLIPSLRLEPEAAYLHGVGLLVLIASVTVLLVRTSPK